METQTIGYYLSAQQSHVWLSQQASGAQYLTQIGAVIEGDLDETRLQGALGELVSRHEMLRTVFRRQTGMKVPFQVVLDSSTPAWERAAATASVDPAPVAQDLLAEQAKLPFDLEHGPLLRALLLCGVTAERHILVLTTPALCADSTTMSSLLGELFGVYADPAAKPVDEPLRYVQFAQWQGELLEENEDESAVAGKKFWQQVMESGEQKIELPGETVSGSVGVQDVVAVPVAAAMQRQIEALAASVSGTNSDVLLAAWESLLYRLTGKTRLATGVTLAGRAYEELAGAVGLIAKMAPVCARFEGSPSFLEAVEQAKAAVEKAAGMHEYLDPASAFSEDAAIAFSYTAVPAATETAGLRVSVLAEETEIAAAKLLLHCVEARGNLEFQFRFDGSRYERPFVEQLTKHFVSLLTAAVENPKQQVARLPLLDEAETARQVFEWNATEAAYPQQTMHSLFEEQARRTPDRMAVRCQDRTLSYAELNRQANQLAHHLRSLGVGPNAQVGLCISRSEKTMVAVLAILKAGGAYVGLSPDHPRARLVQQLDAATVLITEGEFKDRMPERFGAAGAGKTVYFDAVGSWASAPDADLAPSATPDDLAYLIYTSGSTGTPKGVGVRHRNLVNYSWAIARELKLAEHPDGLQFASVSTLLADLGNTCIYPALISGGGLHLLPFEVATDASLMAQYQAKYPVDVLKIVPSHLAALLQSPERVGILPRKYLITGGEALTWDLVDEIASCGASCELINHYGPTETTVGSLMLPLRGVDRELAPKLTVPIGRPIANTQVYVLDPGLQIVPEGMIGELYISGAGVSAGYVGQPKLTDERFLPNPFVAGATMYKTGDLVRYVPGMPSAVEFLGRSDDQVKVRGYRIELGEIEAALLKRPGVRQAVAMAREDEVGKDKRLVAYAVVSGGEQKTGEQLRDELRELLPDYMIPSAVVLLEKLPLTENGKIDRKNLPDAATVSVERPYIAPSTHTEQVIAAIWGEILHREQISLDANFFELGGHSLTATQVVSRIRQQLSSGIALRVLFEAPVLKALAEAVDAAVPEETIVVAPIPRAAREGYRVTVS